jgi:3-dehydroquinate synthase
VTIAAISVEVAPAYTVHVGAGALALAAASLARERSAALISDPRVHGLYAPALDPTARAPVWLAPEGETAKEFKQLSRALEFLAQSGLERRSCLWTLGGGALGDLGGLAAALYMRGIAVVHCPTTLLAQVDASVGGKTAVNLSAGKNLAGVFHQPRAVFADTTVLASLAASEYQSGLGEVLKTSLIEGETLLGLLESECERLCDRDQGLLAEVVSACVRTKARIVAADPHESGLRKQLNLGHTFAHAIEHVAGFGRVPHGVAVAVGLQLALRASRELGLLEDRALETRLANLAARLGLPAGLSELRASTGRALAANDLVGAMRLDKKNRSGELQLVLPLAAGRLDPAVPADGALVESWLG